LDWNEIQRQGNGRDPIGLGIEHEADMKEGGSEERRRVVMLDASLLTIDVDIFV